jgi:hypothetical protein
MGRCAYSTGANGFRKLITVNVWQVQASELFKMALKLEKREKLSSSDLANLRHQATNYDCLLRSIRATPDQRNFFQQIANEEAEIQIRQLVLHNEQPNPLSEYLRVSKDNSRIRLKLKHQGRTISCLEGKLKWRREFLERQSEQLKTLQEEAAVNAEELLALQQKLNQQQQANELLQEQLNQRKVVVHPAAASSTRKRRLRPSVCAAGICGLVFGGIIAASIDLFPRMQNHSTVSGPAHYLREIGILSSP